VPFVCEGEPLLAHVADGDHLGGRRLGEVSDEVRAPVAVSDHSNSDRLKRRLEGLATNRAPVTRLGGKVWLQSNGHLFHEEG